MKGKAKSIRAMLPHEVLQSLFDTKTQDLLRHNPALRNLYESHLTRLRHDTQRAIDLLKAILEDKP